MKYDFLVELRFALSILTISTEVIWPSNIQKEIKLIYPMKFVLNFVFCYILFWKIFFQARRWVFLYKHAWFKTQFVNIKSLEDFGGKYQTIKFTLKKTLIEKSCHLMKDCQVYRTFFVPNLFLHRCQKQRNSSHLISST